MTPLFDYSWFGEKPGFSEETLRFLAEAEAKAKASAEAEASTEAKTEPKTQTKLYATAKENDRVILIGFDDDLEELAELATTAHCVVIGELRQNRDRPHPKSYLGKGKVEELAEYVQNLAATMVIADDELTGTQLAYLGDVCGVKVIDRTMLILDIFANNAKSAEAIAQVEVAQQRYNMAHLKGFGISMSRLGGGIGTRGPGEKKLETDRRAIRDRITELENELKLIANHRQNLRKARLKSQRPVVSLVGYTNAGKSTLMNALTQAGVLAQDRLFATLDTTTRKITQASGVTNKQILLTDTVGFIQKLPHTLIRAFHSTLEELAYSTVIVHVVDAANPACKQQMTTVYETLDHLNCSAIPIITVFNKIDKLATHDFPFDDKAQLTVGISAKTGQGLDQLLQTIEEVLNAMTTTLELIIPHHRGDLLNVLHKEETILHKAYVAEGTQLTARISEKNLLAVQPFRVTGPVAEQG